MSKDWNGTTDLINLGSPAALDQIVPWTICASIYPQGWGEGSLGRVVDRGNVVGNGVVFAVDNLGTTASFQGADYHYDGYTALARASTSSLALNTWAFIAGSFKAGDGGPRLYKGTLSVAVVETSYHARAAESGTLVSDAGESTIIGNRLNADRTFDGLIEHVSVWDNVLTAAQLDALRLRPYAPLHRFATAAGTLINLKGYWPLTESAAATCRDHSGNGSNGTVTGTTVGVNAPYLWTRRGAQATIWTPTAPPTGRIWSLAGHGGGLVGKARGLAG